MSDKDPYDHLVPPTELGGPEISMTPPEPPQWPQRPPYIHVTVTTPGPQDGQSIKFDKLLRTPPDQTAGPIHVAPAGINPKDLLGMKKPDLTLVPPAASVYCALGMANGVKKYGRANYRTIPIQAVGYVAAAKRHLDLWMDGEEFSDDTDPPVPHLGHALATIAILVDAIENGNVVDDRPPPGKLGETMKKFTIK